MTSNAPPAAATVPARAPRAPAPIAALLALLLLAVPAHAQQPPPPRSVPAASTPTLVVMLTVDQLRPDYFTRFGPQLTGGLARLSRGGALFTNAYQDHAITETAPGHSVTLAGRYPRSTGIVTNAAGVFDAQSPLVGGAPGAPASPFRFRGTTLTDWLRTRDARTRALSVSRKDRGAILPLGRAHQDAYWYSPNGTFTTSRYYRDTLPGWLQAFNARRTPQSWAGRSWTPLLPLSAYPEPDSVRVESNGVNVVFPHVLPSDPVLAAQQLPDFPWMDELTLAVALEGMQQLALGAGPQTDVLAISLSTTDAVGHRYGPDSRELHDQILQLDRALGTFLDSLYRLRDSSTVIIALTADHGVAPYPGVQSADRTSGTARFLSEADLLRPTIARLVSAGVPATAFRFDGGLLQVDRAAFAAARVNADSTVRAFARELRAHPAIARVQTRREIAAADTVRDAISRRWIHMLPPDLDVALIVTTRPWTQWGNGGYTTHGSPYDYDARVPLLFYGAPFRPGVYAATAGVVDIAPTLAHVLGVTPSERLDGRVLRAALRPVAAPATRQAPAAAAAGRRPATAPR